MSKKEFIIILTLILIIITALTAQMGNSENSVKVFSPLTYEYREPNSECTLFVLDYSASMNEKLNNIPKNEMLKFAMNKIVKTIPKNNKTGLRIYGHKRSLLTYHACKASENIVPITENSCNAIKDTMQKTKSVGMTPITYSLKQAVQNDFQNCKNLKHIILISDGGENCDESPCDYIVELTKNRNDIKIDVIALDINSEDDFSQLECVALVTRGKIFTANNFDELTESIKTAVNSNKSVEAVIIPHK